MSATNFFENYDDPIVYNAIQGQLCDADAQNFVVEFGADEAKIAFNLDTPKFEQLMKHDNPPREKTKPVRWM
jgi:hypothetical protein